MIRTRGHPRTGPRARAPAGAAGLPGFLFAGLLAGLALVVAAPAAAQSTHVLVVTGLGGAPEYTARFAEWGGELVRAAVDAGVPAGNVVWLAEDEALDRRVAAVARKDAVVSELAALAQRSAPGDVVLVALFGHGSARGDEARINLPGPDLSATELAALLDPLDSRRLVVVNAASASGGFVGPLSDSGRVVVTATRSTRENEATRFGGYFVEALAGDAADTDKDGRVSILEAFEYARLEVARAYSTAGQLPTEHALLDDDGDGQGTLEPGPGDPGDGRLAATLALAPPSPAPAATDDPGLGALREREARLQEQLAELRNRQDSMDVDTYQAELEALLLEIARTGRAIREAGTGAAADSAGSGGGAR